MKYLVLILLTIVVGIGCYKAVDKRQHTAGWDDSYMANAALRQFLNDQASLAQTFDIDPNDFNELVTKNGIHLKIEKKSFLDESGAVVTTVPIVVTVNEYFTNRDLITGEVSTCEGNNGILNTSGAFNIYANGKLGVSLHLQIPIVVDVPARGAINSDNRIFRGFENDASANRILWQQDSIEWTTVPNGYEFILHEMNWCNVDRYLKDLGAGLTGIGVKLHAGFGNTNTMCFLIFPNKGAVRLEGEPFSETFVTGNYKLPIGLGLKLFTIAKVDKGYSYNLKDFTITENQLITIDTMKAVSENDLKTVIANDLD